MSGPSIEEVLRKFPQVRPQDLEVTTGPEPDGIFLRVRHLPSGKERGERKVTAEAYRATLHRLVAELLAEVTGGAPKGQA
jgi:hypothetical protein